MTGIPKQWFSWIGLGVAIVALLGIGAFFIAREVPDWIKQFGLSGPHQVSVIYASIFGMAALLALFTSAIVLGVQYEPATFSGPPRPKPYRAFRNVVVVLLGSLTGWALAVAFSPFDDADAAKIYSISQAAAAFLTGYILNKFDKFLDKTLFEDGADAERWLVLGLFIAGLLASLLMTFTARLYSSDLADDVPAAIFSAAPGSTTVGNAVIDIGKDNKLSVNGQVLGEAAPGAEVRLFTGKRRVYVAGVLLNKMAAYPAALPDKSEADQKPSNAAAPSATSARTQSGQPMPPATPTSSAAAAGR